MERNATLMFCTQKRLDTFLQKFQEGEEAKKQEEERKKEEARKMAQMEVRRRKEEQLKALAPISLSFSMLEKMQEGTLGRLSEVAIAQALMAGKLASGFSDHLAWSDNVKRVEHHEAVRAQELSPIVGWRQEQAVINARLQDVQSELDRLQQETVQLNQRHQQLEQHIQDHTKACQMKDLSGLLEFARRVQPIEERLVAHLEKEMSKKNPQLIALSNNASHQPKLSLLLNCMGVREAVITATGELDSESFKQLTQDNTDLLELLDSDSVFTEDIKDDP